MKHVTFVTGNDVKFHSAQHIAAALGFSIDQAVVDFEEIQGGGKAIASHKAQQAFEQLQKPIVITDDEWIIPGLRGFPGAYMKQINDWLTTEDLLNLTRPLKDRRIILRQHAIYQDKNGQQYFVDDIEGLLLPEARGENKFSNLAIVSFDGGKSSRAEGLARGEPLINEHMVTVWHHLADWLRAQK